MNTLARNVVVPARILGGAGRGWAPGCGDEGGCNHDGDPDHFVDGKSGGPVQNRRARDGIDVVIQHGNFRSYHGLVHMVYELSIQRKRCLMGEPMGEAVAFLPSGLKNDGLPPDTNDASAHRRPDEDRPTQRVLNCRKFAKLRGENVNSLISDPAFWSRVQFGFALTYHYLFRQLNKGLAWFLV